MTANLQYFIAICGGLFFLIIIFLLYRFKISEKYSVLWLIGGVGILFLSSNPKILDKLAHRVGVDYPPTLLFFLSTLILLGLHLYQSMEITKLNKKLKDLTQFIALNSSEIQPYKEQQGGKQHGQSD